MSASYEHYYRSDRGHRRTTKTAWIVDPEHSLCAQPTSICPIKLCLSVEKGLYSSELGTQLDDRFWAVILSNSLTELSQQKTGYAVTASVLREAAQRRLI